MEICVAFVVLVFSGLSLAKLDMSKICINSNLGDVIPNPEDCSSYILCESDATIFYCEPGLHFDATRNVCSWPNYARCKLESSSQAEAREEIIKEPIHAEVDAETNIYYSPFVAIDVMSGLEVDPMFGYDPQHVACRHFGAYFLPHPLHCRFYILCAYGHIHKYSCGSGTMWNFKTQKCEISIKAECYSKTIEDDEEIANSILPIATDNPLMVCYTIIATTTDDGPTTNTWQPTGSIYNATATGSLATTLPYSTTDATTKSLMPSTTVTSSKSPNSTGPTVLDCPSKTQSYLAHPKDCSKYYMCIMGIPVLTSCPVGLYWDSTMEYCDSAKNVRCFQKRI